jgi:hypothetical protein
LHIHGKAIVIFIIPLVSVFTKFFVSASIIRMFGQHPLMFGQHPLMFGMNMWKRPEQVQQQRMQQLEAGASALAQQVEVSISFL